MTGEKDKKMRRRRKDFDIFKDDEFSEAFKHQGNDGKLIRMLYLRNEMETYMRRVRDESIYY